MYRNEACTKQAEEVFVSKHLAEFPLWPLNQLREIREPEEVLHIGKEMRKKKLYLCYGHLKAFGEKLECLNKMITLNHSFSGF